MNDITCNIKAFYRPKKFQQCLSSVIDAGIWKIIVGYDGPKELLEEHKEIIDKYKGDNYIKLIELPFNAGLSKTRNKMVEETKTEYILQLDDDNYIPRNIMEPLSFLKDKPLVGGVSFGWLKDDEWLPMMDAYDIEIINGFFFKTYNVPKHVYYVHNIQYMLAFDFVPNQGIFRKAVFDEIKWDENYIIDREHEDYFLSLKLYTAWKFAITPSIYLRHSPGGDKEFMSFRTGDKALTSAKYFLAKWNLKGISPSLIPPCRVRYLFNADTQFQSSFKHNMEIRKRVLMNQQTDRDYFTFEPLTEKEDGFESR